MRFARIEKGVIAALFDSSGPVNIDGRDTAFRHLVTWARMQPEELAKRNLVVVAERQQPTFDPLRQELGRTRAKVGDALVEDGWEVIERPNARTLVIETIKDRAWLLWGRSSWDKTRTAWLDHRDALKAHGVSLVQAFDAGQTIDIQAGSIGGSGLWPV